MGCGLRKLEDPDDSSPGKIFSTLKRPQVETKTDSAYEYVLLDFTLEASSNPEVIRISSVLDIAPKVEEYYSKGYVVGAVHPIMLPIGRRRSFPASHMYRVVLSRLKLSQKHAAPGGQRHPRLVIEECPLMYETLTNEVVKELLEKVNEAAKRGKKFVGFVTQHFPQPKACNGTSTDGSAELESTLGRRNREHRRKNSDENYKNWNEGTLSGHLSESGIEEEMQGESSLLQDADFQFGKEVSPVKPRKGDDKLYTVFNVFDDDSTCWTYHEGILSMKVTRKGPVISTLEADWLELTTFYYKQGLSLIDSFVHWETFKGDYLPKSLEGLFIYEEEGAGVPGSNRKGNDAIVVEQWTVIEGCEIKTDYGPLLHTLAEFGWLLTCVLPTPIVRHDSEGNLATKQVIFLQRPVMWNSAVQTPEKKSLRQVIGEERGKVSSRSVGLDTATSRPVETGQPPDEFHLSPSKQCWIKEGSSHYGGFPGFSSSDGVLRELDDGQFDQEDGVTQVTFLEAKTINAYHSEADAKCGENENQNKTEQMHLQHSSPCAVQLSYYSGILIPVHVCCTVNTERSVVGALTATPCSDDVTSTSCSGNVPFPGVDDGPTCSEQIHAVTGAPLTDSRQAPQEMAAMGEIRSEYSKLKL